MNLCAETLFSGPPEKIVAGGPVDHCSKKFVSNPVYCSQNTKLIK